MKKILLFFISILFLVNCSEDDQSAPTISQISFGIDNSNQSSKTNETLEPSKIVLTIKDQSDEIIYNKKVLDLFDFNGQYLTEIVSLQTGSYTITEYFVTDSENNIIYASPLEESDLAIYVNDPLPIEFTLSTDQVTQITPEVLATQNHTPEEFGYTTFGFEVVDIVNTGDHATKEENKRLAKVLSSTKMETNLSILIEDITGKGISSTTISLNNEIYTTDESGSVLIENIELNEEYNVLNVSANGYTNGIFTFTPSKNGVTSVIHTLLKEPLIKNISSTEGGEVVNQNVTLNFPSNSIANQEGNLFNGMVSIALTYFNPDNENFEASMPGTLAGLGENEEIQALISKGMVKIDLTDDEGNELEIIQGKEVQIKIPATENDSETIPLWHLNEDHGIWVQTGVATKQGNQYIANVTHFSTYNLDYKAQNSRFKIKVINENDQPMTNQKAKLKAFINGNTYTRHIVTDNLGEFDIIRAPKEGEYSLVVQTPCNTIEKNIGAINNNETKIIKILDSDYSNNERAITFEGTLNQCEDQPWANKAFKIELYNGNQIDSFTSYTDENGNYSVSKILCDYDTTSSYNAKITIYENDQLLSKLINNTFDENLIYKEITLCNGSIDVNTDNITDNTVIHFPDVHFKRSIQKILKIYNRDITFSDVKKISSYNPHDISSFYDEDKIKSLEGLQFFVNLKSLDLSYFSINPDFIPDLNSLKKLEYLNLRGNYPYESISLKNLPNLKTIVLSDNKLTSFSMENLNNLEVLKLKNNLLQNTFELKNHMKLSFIDISSNSNLEEIHLENLTNLEKINTYGSQDSGILKTLFLKNLPKVDHLWLSIEKTNSIESVSYIDMPKLESLTLNNLNTNNLNLHNLTSLKKLALNAGSSDLKIGNARYFNITNISALEELSLGSNYSDLSQFTHCDKLTDINVGPSLVSNLNALKEMRNIKNIYIRWSDVSNLYFLKDISTLERLNIRDTPISGEEFKYLYNLKNLKELNISTGYSHPYGDYSIVNLWNEEHISELKKALPNLSITKNGADRRHY